MTQEVNYEHENGYDSVYIIINMLTSQWDV